MDFFKDAIREYWLVFLAVILLNLAFALGAIWLVVKVIKMAWG